jgi:hypothetical protein
MSTDGLGYGQSILVFLLIAMPFCRTNSVGDAVQARKATYLYLKSESVGKLKILP